MKIDSNINILGSIPDWDLINVFLNESIDSLLQKGSIHTYTAIKTDKSVKRFEKAISATLIRFHNEEIEILIRDILNNERITSDSLLILYWNASFNNDLLKYLNDQIYFVAFYSGRLTIKQDEVVACLKDLKENEIELKKWSESTLQITASKYLTLLKKFHLMEGSHKKIIIHPYLSEKMFVLFVYWICAIEPGSNLLESSLLPYSFNEKPVFIERLTQKKFSKYFQFIYTGDKLKIETLIPYSKIYHAVK